MLKTKWKSRLAALALACVPALALAGCGAGQKTTLNIAQQFGVAYAPLEIMKANGILDKYLPAGVTANWQQFGGPTAIREAMLAGDVDFGFMGVAPVIVGAAGGMEWRYATGISRNQVAITTTKPEVKRLADFLPTDRIAVISPACTQHVLLCMAARQELGDGRALDNQLVAMSLPDAANALISGTEIVGDVSTPPYLQKELENDAHILYEGTELMGGPFTMISGVAMERFYKDYPALYEAFLSALQESVDYINDHMDEAAAQLAPVYGITEQELKEQMDYNGCIYNTELLGVEKFAQAMYEMGFVDKQLTMEELAFPNVKYQ